MRMQLRSICLLVALLAASLAFQPRQTTHAFPRSRVQHKLQSLTAIRAGAAVQEVKSKVEFDRKLAEAGTNLVVVDFTASWCMPCKMISPVYESMARKPEYKDVHFLKVDVDEAQDVAKEYQIRSMPTFLFIRNGQVVENFSGALVDKLQSTVAGLVSAQS